MEKIASVTYVGKNNSLLSSMQVPVKLKLLGPSCMCLIEVGGGGAPMFLFVSVLYLSNLLHWSGISLRMGTFGLKASAHENSKNKIFLYAGIR